MADGPNPSAFICSGSMGGWSKWSDLCRSIADVDRVLIRSVSTASRG